MREVKCTEQALEAWMAAEPEGIILPFSRLHLATSRLRIPMTQEEIATTFQHFVSEQQEHIPFLVFWKAFSHLSRLEEALQEDEAEETTNLEFLFLELETFRDSLLRFFALQKTDFPIHYLRDEMEKTRKMSEFPEFWDKSMETLKQMEAKATKDSKRVPKNEEDTGLILRRDFLPNEEKVVTMEEATMAMITLLLEAISFTREIENQELERRSLEAAEEKKRQDEERKLQEGENNGNKLPVYIHVYDVSQEQSIRKLNRITANKFSPLKFGGVFHAGVEVADLEWSYGASMVESIPGIVCHEIKTHPQHRYRQSIFIGHTTMNKEEIAEMISELVESYPGWDYDLLRRNCCHFADDMCQRMGVGRIPGWIYRFARVGAGFDTMISTLKNLRGPMAEDSAAATLRSRSKEKPLPLMAA